MENSRRNPWPWLTGEHKLDCSHPTEHAEDHVPHRDGPERLVCLVCHPPYYVLQERARLAQEATDGP